LNICERRNDQCDGKKNDNDRQRRHAPVAVAGIVAITIGKFVIRIASMPPLLRSQASGSLPQMQDYPLDQQIGGGYRTSRFRIFETAMPHWPHSGRRTFFAAAQITFFSFAYRTQKITAYRARTAAGVSARPRRGFVCAGTRGGTPASIGSISDCP